MIWASATSTMSSRLSSSVSSCIAKAASTACMCTRAIDPYQLIHACKHVHSTAVHLHWALALPVCVCIVHADGSCTRRAALHGTHARTHAATASLQKGSSRSRPAVRATVHCLHMCVSTYIDIIT